MSIRKFIVCFTLVCQDIIKMWLVIVVNKSRMLESSIQDDFALSLGGGAKF